MTPWMALVLVSAQPVAPSAWWVFGPFGCPGEATFAAAEMLDCAPASEWTRVTALGGRELRARQITTATPGLLDLRAVLALDRPLTCAYVGVRLEPSRPARRAAGCR